MKTLASVLLIPAILAFSGCGGLDSGPTDSDSAGVAVTYRSDPLADVHVRLHGSATGPVLAAAISSTDGIARFEHMPSPQPDEYFVSLCSLSDGGWILDAKYLKPSDSGLKLKSLATGEVQPIELPRSAVRPLTPINHY
ncbi:signal peptide protein [Rhodopirellula maiorica SM1]|uniref:Signal peptide protein n=1 Tax=Rhodopirellula maiorica SM1 TaxID=1265738 RepID=M5RN02_9BACT|nr:hypothetical protein [Rhodopirellula maiorica]EMI15339.1 signal peptide protein [Rhodopirellula maiorica SM1]